MAQTFFVNVFQEINVFLIIFLLAQIDVNNVFLCFSFFSFLNKKKKNVWYRKIVNIFFFFLEIKVLAKKKKTGQKTGKTKTKLK